MAILLAGLFGGLFLGFPMSFTLGASSIVAALIYGGPKMLSFTATQIYAGMTSSVLIAIPLFVFIANLLEKSGIADDMYKAVQQWLAPLPGALAITTVGVCTIIAAISGIAAAGVVTMGIIAIPIMLKHGYDKSLVIGPIMAGGALGILIPPSVVFVLYGMLTKTSIGRLFAGGLVPGLILSGFYMIYIGLSCHFRPELGPPLPREERVSLKQKIALTKGLIAPIVLILAILGSIFLGIASPTEAAAIGGAATVACVAIRGKLTWQLLKETCDRTLVVSCMIMWIIFGASMFSCIFISLGTAHLIREALMGLEIAPIMLIVLMQLSYLVLGCITEEVTMLCLTVPIYGPILSALGFDPVWFGVLFLLNLQIGYLTPPFGYCLFFMRGVAPPEISISDIYRSILPFISLAWCAVLLVLFFPQLALWLPNTVFGLK